MKMRRAEGFVLLVMLLLMVTMGSAYLVSALNKNYIGNADLRAQREVQRGLRDAQLALIAHGLIEDNTPGTLPSPSGEGILNGRSTPTGFTGTPGQTARRLPWHFLGLPPQINGECLWYAVSNTYRNANLNTNQRDQTSDTAINPGTQGKLNVTMTGGNIKAAAILIAPGPSRPEQGGRSNSGEACAAGTVNEFLETSNATSSGTFVDTSAGTVTNDKLLPITHAQLLRPVLRRVLTSLNNSGIRSEIVARMKPGSSGDLNQLRCNRVAPEDTCTTHDDFDALLAQTEKSLLEYTNMCAGIKPETGSISYKSAVSWLCFNNWYANIAYEQVTKTLKLSLAPYDSHQCSLALDTGQIQCTQ